MKWSYLIPAGVLLGIVAITVVVILRPASEPARGERLESSRRSHRSTDPGGDERNGLPGDALVERKSVTLDSAAVPPDEGEMADAERQGRFYRVSGRVVDHATGEGVNSAVVQAWRDKPPLSISGSERDADLLEAAAVQDVSLLSDTNRLRDSELKCPNPWGDREFRQTESDSDGSFVIDDIPAHRFYLKAFGRLRVPVEMPLIVITEGRERTGVELRLDYGAGLRGRVLQPCGRPAEGAKVVVGRGVGPVGTVTGSLSMRIPDAAYTDSNGEFAFPAVPGPGVYILSASHESAARSDTIKVSVDRGETTVPDIFLEVGATLDLVAKDQSGSKVEGVFVRLQPSRMNIDELTMLADTFKGRGAWTDPHGRLQFEGLKEGSYRLEARHSDYMPVIGERVTIGLGERVSKEITLLPGRVLSGTVLDPQARPIIGAQVRVYRLPSPTDIRSFSASRDARWHPVAEDGTFCVTGLSEDELGVSARAPGYAMTETEARAGESPLAIQLKPLASIEGSVVSRITGDIVREFQLEIDHKTGMSMDIASMETDALLDRPIPFRTDDGRFALMGLEAGSYKLKVHAPGHAAEESDWILLKGGEVKRGELFLLGMESFIEGSVLDEASGQPIEGAQIVLRDNSCSQIKDMMRALLKMPRDTTNMSGLFRIGGLSAGTYHLTA
ncbi:MAG: carboxypeptidase regulatory-like domain-containing protein [Planctomycetota bacterium]